MVLIDIYLNLKSDAKLKVPTFWTEVEKYTCDLLSQMPTVKYVDDRIQIKNRVPVSAAGGGGGASAGGLSVLCLDLKRFKSKVFDQFGIRSVVEQIARYMNARGRIVWWPESLRVRERVFVRPGVFFEMFHVLYRANFAENFADAHTQLLRHKLTNGNVNLNPDYIRRLSRQLVEKGTLDFNLLRLLWSPILMTDSTLVVYEAAVLFMSYFFIGYPLVAKAKLKLIFKSQQQQQQQHNQQHPQQTPMMQQYDALRANSLESISASLASFANNNNNNSSNASFIGGATNAAATSSIFDVLVVPHYLPVLDNASEAITATRLQLKQDCSRLQSIALSSKFKQSIPALVPRISHVYTFPWGLVAGIFERFSANCVINSDLYYKTHFKDFILAYNEDNSVG